MGPAQRDASHDKQADAAGDKYPGPKQAIDTHPTEPVERVATASSTTPSDSSRPHGMSRMPTQRDDVAELSRHPTALSRIETGRSQHFGTVGSRLKSRASSRREKPLPAFGDGKPYPPMLPEQEQYVVQFDGPDDPMHAMNWPLKKKLRIGVALGYVTLVAAFGSSIFSAATRSVAQEFGVSTEVGVLGVSLYVLGFATGPILWAPFSELYGRRTPLLISSFAFGIFSIAVAVGKDAQTVFICRFFSGFMGACPLTCVGAVFSDMFNNATRGVAIAIFSVTVFAGPLLAPFIGGFIDMSYLGWRWTEYIVAIMAFFGLGLLLLLMEETYPPVILVNKAAELRRRTKNWGIHAKQEEIEIDLRELLEKNLSRPLKMLFTEPIVLAISIYMAFIYGLLYLFLTMYEVVFQQIHGFNEGVGGLPYFGMILGEFCAAAFIIVQQPRYNRKLKANNNVPIPEWRLPPVILGGVLFALGLFWFGWSGYRADIPWIVPTLSGLFTGFGLMSIFLQCLNYIIDAYLIYAASAIAANTFLRSMCGAGFPLFASYLISGIGVQWTGTLLGCIALLLVPLPILFYLKGAKIREKSTYAPTHHHATQGASSPNNHNDSDSNEGKDAEKQA